MKQNGKILFCSGRRRALPVFAIFAVFFTCTFCPNAAADPPCQATFKTGPSDFSCDGQKRYNGTACESCKEIDGQAANTAKEANQEICKKIKEEGGTAAGSYGTAGAAPGSRQTQAGLAVVQQMIKKYTGDLNQQIRALKDCKSKLKGEVIENTRGPNAGDRGRHNGVPATDVTKSGDALIKNWDSPANKPNPSDQKSPLLQEQIDTYNKITKSVEDIQNEAGKLEQQGRGIGDMSKKAGSNAEKLGKSNNKNSDITGTDQNKGAPSSSPQQQAGGGSPGGSPGGDDKGGGDKGGGSGGGDPGGGSPQASTNQGAPGGGTSPTPDNSNPGNSNSANNSASGNGGANNGNGGPGSPSGLAGGSGTNTNTNTNISNLLTNPLGNSPATNPLGASASAFGNSSTSANGSSFVSGRSGAKAAVGKAGGGAGGSAGGGASLDAKNDSAKGANGVGVEGVNGAGSGTNSASGGGSSGGGDEVLSPFGKPLGDPKFNLAGSETDASVKNMMGDLGENGSGVGEADREPAADVTDGIGEKNSTDLFERVHYYHEYCAKKSCVSALGMRKVNGS